jgi:hypothetical protein
MNKHTRFYQALRNTLYNMAYEENGNDHLDEEKLAYYRGMLVSTLALLQAINGYSFYDALADIYANCQVSAQNIIYASLPLSWKADWRQLDGIK